MNNGPKPLLLDAATGLWNWNGIMQLLKGELSRAERNQCPVAMMILSIDQLRTSTPNPDIKSCLILQAAARLRESVRPSDLLGCCENDRFVIFADGCSSTGAQAMGARISARFAYDPVICAGQTLNISVSIGITVAQPTAALEAIQIFESAAESLNIAIERGDGGTELAVLF